MKVGSDDSARDIAAREAVREAIGPDVKLRVDGNMGWQTAKQAIAVIRAMEECDLELVEQPLPAHDLDGMAEVRRSIGVPLMADESIRNPRSAMEVIRRGAADIANVYVTEAGGLLNAAKIFAMCEAAGMPCMIGSMPEFGIGTAAQIHLGVAMNNLGPDSDTCGVLYHQEDLLDDAAADRERILLSAGRSRSRRRGRHEGAGSLEQGGRSRAIARIRSDAGPQPQNCDLIIKDGCLLTMDARRTSSRVAQLRSKGTRSQPSGRRRRSCATGARPTSSMPKARSSTRGVSMRICTSTRRPAVDSFAATRARAPQEVRTTPTGKRR